MQNQSEKEITLFDIFDDVIKGWYLFIGAIIISMVVSYLLYSNQKNIFTISVDTQKIDDIERSSLPQNLDNLDIFYFFHSDIKNKQLIESIINNENLYQRIENPSNFVFDSLNVDVSDGSSKLYIKTIDLKSDEQVNFIEDTKNLLISLLNYQQEKSFSKLKDKYSSVLINLDNEIKDEEKAFNISIKADNSQKTKKLLDQMNRVEIIYNDLEKKLKDNLEIAILLNIESPQKITKNDQILFQNENIQNDLGIKNALLSFIEVDVPFYIYGSVIISKEIELMKRNKLDYENNLLSKIKEIENETNNINQFKKTNTYIDLILKVAENKRNISQINFLEKTGFKFISYNSDDVKIKSEQISLTYYLLFTTIIFLILAFIINTFIQYKKKLNN